MFQYFTFLFLLFDISVLTTDAALERKLLYSFEQLRLLFSSAIQKKTISDTFLKVEQVPEKCILLAERPKNDRQLLSPRFSILVFNKNVSYWQRFNSGLTNIATYVQKKSEPKTFVLYYRAKPSCSHKKQKKDVSLNRNHIEIKIKNIFGRTYGCEQLLTIKKASKLYCSTYVTWNTLCELMKRGKEQ